ncbi:hypothetical protein GGR55DRAFT_674927 [Xylaria sp. FL0064]|nr:hypothetical protein GGR55DRAFT_674927 [Xylaria sp. FL0064]
MTHTASTTASMSPPVTSVWRLPRTIDLCNILSSMVLVMIAMILNTTGVGDTKVSNWMPLQTVINCYLGLICRVLSIELFEDDQLDVTRFAYATLAWSLTLMAFTYGLVHNEVLRIACTVVAAFAWILTFSGWARRRHGESTARKDRAGGREDLTSTVTTV